MACVSVYDSSLVPTYFQSVLGGWPLIRYNCFNIVAEECDGAAQPIYREVVSSSLHHRIDCRLHLRPRLRAWRLAELHSLRCGGSVLLSALKHRSGAASLDIERERAASCHMQG